MLSNGTLINREDQKEWEKWIALNDHPRFLECFTEWCGPFNFPPGISVFFRVNGMHPWSHVGEKGRRECGLVGAVGCGGQANWLL